MTVTYFQVPCCFTDSTDDSCEFTLIWYKYVHLAGSSTLRHLLKMTAVHTSYILAIPWMTLVIIKKKQICGWWMTHVVYFKMWKLIAWKPQNLCIKIILITLLSKMCCCLSVLHISCSIEPMNVPKREELVTLCFTVIYKCLPELVVERVFFWVSLSCTICIA